MSDLDPRNWMWSAAYTKVTGLMCDICHGSGRVLIVEEIPAGMPDRFDDLPPQPEHDTVDLPRWDLCLCILAPGFVNWIEVAT